MELNSLLFPAPSIKYTSEELDGEIIYIPRYFKYNNKHRTALNNLNSNNPVNQVQDAQME